jgi:hypothetical protein
MINKYGVMLNAGYATMRVGLIAPVELAEALAGEVISGAGNNITGFNIFLLQVNLPESPCYYTLLINRILFCENKTVVFFMVPAGKYQWEYTYSEKNKAALRPPYHFSY